MKTKKKKYLPLYEKWMASGVIDNSPGIDSANGMCDLFKKHRLWKRVSADPKDKQVLWYENIEIIWWGSGFSESLFYKDPVKVKSEFTPLRQTLVLFMCAMNEEL